MKYVIMIMSIVLFSLTLSDIYVSNTEYKTCEKYTTFAYETYETDESLMHSNVSDNIGFIKSKISENESHFNISLLQLVILILTLLIALLLIYQAILY